MKKFKFAKSVIILSLLSTFAQANSNGIYMGADVSFKSFGNDLLTVTNKDKSTQSYEGVESSYANIKIGYQHFKNNRIEMYYRFNTLDTKEGAIQTKTFGINYEWAFSSFSTKNLIPYALIGIGGGIASSNKIQHLDKAEVGESNFGLGVHYYLNDNIDLQVGYIHTCKGFTTFEENTIDKTSTLGFDNVTVGMSYKF